MQDVKGRMIDRAPNATRLTDKLIAKGLVIRERCEEDRRVIFARISQNGLELLDRIHAHNLAEAQASLSGLNEADALALNRILDQWRG